MFVQRPHVPQYHKLTTIEISHTWDDSLYDKQYIPSNFQTCWTPISVSCGGICVPCTHSSIFIPRQLCFGVYSFSVCASVCSFMSVRHTLISREYKSHLHEILYNSSLYQDLNIAVKTGSFFNVCPPQRLRFTFQVHLFLTKLRAGYQCCHDIFAC